MTAVFQQIVDIQTGEPSGVGSEGEVWVRGPQIAKGYLDMPEQTRDVFLDDGWVKTGRLIILQ